MKDFQNLYEVRKTVRFELKPYFQTRKILKGNNNYENLDSYIKHIKQGEFEENFNWNQFCIDQYKDFLENSKYIFEFLKEINEELHKENGNLSKRFIQFDLKRTKGILKTIPSLKKIQGFKDLVEKLFEIEKEYSELIKFLLKLEEDTKMKNEKQSDISKYLRKLSYLNRNFLTIFSFLGQNQGKETDEEILENFEKLKNSLGESFEKLNNSIIASHENETTGACIGKFSFNKYSLFRRETETLKEKYEDYKQQNKRLVKELIENKDIKDDKGEKVDIKLETILNLQLEQEDSILQGKLKNFNFDRNLDEVISELDLINGQLLNDYIQKFKEQYKLNKGIITVVFETYFDNIINANKNNYKKSKSARLVFANEDKGRVVLAKGQTLEGYEYLYLINDDNSSHQYKENKELANKFLKIIFKLKNINKDYNTIKIFRDKLAKYRGIIRQDLKASEREFINEAMIRYYAKLLEKDGCYFLALTPKEKIIGKDLKNIEIEKHIKNTIYGNTFKVYNYSHLNFQSLEKLCLMKDGNLEENDFLVKQWNNYKNQKNDISINIITFRNHITKSLSKLKENNGEDWTIFNNKITELGTIEEIVNFINENFHKFEEKEILTEKIFELAENGEIELYQIYSKDFNIFDENFLSQEDEYLKNLGIVSEDYSEEKKLVKNTIREKGKNENLFTIYFREIFKNTDTFLGQEGGLFFRKSDKNAEHKRFKSHKFFVSFDLLFNKGKQNHKARLCEKTEKITQEHIKQINEFTTSKIKNISLENLILVGIDRGEKEHITYGVYNGNLEFQGIIGNTNFVKKTGKKQEAFEIINDGHFTLSNDLENENKIYKQLETKTKYFDENGNDGKNKNKPCKQLETKTKYFDENGENKKKKQLQLNSLEDFHIKSIFESGKNGEYFTHLQNGGKFILNNKNYGFTILDKNGNEIKIVDKKDGKEVIDYYLLFESEKFKRILEVNDPIKYSQNMYNLKKGYISVIKDFFKQIILKYKKEGKEVVLIFENQTSNKGDITNKYLGATILSDIEEQIINEFNYLKFKENKDTLQLTPNIRKKDVLLENNNKYEKFGNCIFINQDNTSSGCPVCKEKFIEIEKKIVKGKEIINIKEVLGGTLYGHGTGNNEGNMKHLTNEEYDCLYNNNEKFKRNNSSKNGNKKDNKYLPGKTKDGKICDYHMKNNDYGFSFLKSGDDLATYNIAKKGIEYIFHQIKS